MFGSIEFVTFVKTEMGRWTAKCFIVAVVVDGFERLFASEMESWANRQEVVRTGKIEVLKNMNNTWGLLYLLISFNPINLS